MDELDDLVGGPKPAPSRARFAPRNSKPKPQQPKLKTKLDSELLDQQSQGITTSSSINGHTTKNEVLEIKPQSPPCSTAENDSFKMEIDDVKLEEKKDDIMEEDVIENKKEDRVLREIDVFFKPKIDPDTKLYVFQYPLRPSWRPYVMEERCEEVRVNSSKLGVEIDLSVDTNPKNYDDSSHQKLPPTMTLTSVMSSEETGAAHVVGLLFNNKLCIYPMHAAVQMRPSLDYHARGSKKKVNVASTSAEGAIKSEDDKDENSDWIALKYLGARSDNSSSYLKKMALHEASAIQFSMSPGDYIGSLCPASVNNNSKPKGPSRRDMFSLPLEERYSTWLTKGPHINRFDTLKHLAPNETDEDVLKVLLKYASLVQGLWVTKTSLLKDFLKGSNRQPLARDYVILLFRKNILISYDQIKAAGPLGKFMREALTGLAIERPSLQDWKFKEAPDVSFIKSHSNIVKEQDQHWERIEKTIISSVFQKKGELGLKGSAMAAPDKPGAVNNPTKNMPNNPAGADSKVKMSNETREALPKALNKLFQTHKHCSFQQICQRLREMAVSESTRPKGMAKEAVAAAYGVDAHRSELVEMIGQVAIDIHGVYVPKTSYDHPQYDSFRNVVIGLLIVEGANAKLRKATIMEAAKMQLGRDVTPNEYQMVMNDLCTSSGPIWVLKNSSGSSK